MRSERHVLLLRQLRLLDKRRLLGRERVQEVQQAGTSLIIIIICNNLPYSMSRQRDANQGQLHRFEELCGGQGLLLTVQWWTVLDTLQLPDTHHLGFEITDFRAQLRGVCADCRKKATTSKLDPLSLGMGLALGFRKRKREPQARKQRRNTR